jgi:hypothetical protein
MKAKYCSRARMCGPCCGARGCEEGTRERAQQQERQLVWPLTIGLETNRGGNAIYCLWETHRSAHHAGREAARHRCSKNRDPGSS